MTPSNLFQCIIFLSISTIVTAISLGEKFISSLSYCCITPIQPDITDEFISHQSKYEKPVILISMHGNSTASFMADVVNKLIGEENTFSYDMPLDNSSETAYEELKGYIPSINQGG